MMTLGKNSLLVTALLGLSTPLLADSKTLFVNGVNAAVHGDLSVDKGDWRNQESYSALRMKAGFQLIRVGFVGLTIGFQKVGFYTAERNWTKADASKTRFDYRGPVEELHLFPDAMFGFSVAAHQGTGFSFTKGAVADFGVTCPASDTDCSKTEMERSRLKVNEYTVQVNWTFRYGLQLFVGAGTRHVEGKPEYLVRRASDTDAGQTGDFWESYNAAKWKMDNQFYLIGLRGTTL